MTDPLQDVKVIPVPRGSILVMRDVTWDDEAAAISEIADRVGHHEFIVIHLSGDAPKIDALDLHILASLVARHLNERDDTEPEPLAPTWFLAVCQVCEPLAPQPFRSRQACERWAELHENATKHPVIIDQHGEDERPYL